MLLSSLGFALGIGLTEQLARLPGIFQLGLLAAFAALAWRLRAYPLVWLTLGVIWASWRGQDMLGHLLREDQAGIYRIQGCIDGLPNSSPRGDNLQFEFASDRSGFPHKLRLLWPRPPHSLAPGQCWLLSAKLEPLHAKSASAALNPDINLLAQGVGGSGVVLEQPEPLAQGVDDGLGARFAIWRQLIATRIARLEPLQEPELLQALTVGWQNSVKPQQWDLFRRTGTTHLIVISGSHIALVAGLCFLLAKRLWLRLGWPAFSPDRIAAAAAGLAALLYSGLAGYSVPTLRALLMLALALIAGLGRHHVSVWRYWSLALISVLAWQPLSVLVPGFWLSFVAVACLFYIGDSRLRRPQPLTALLLAQCAVFLGLAPLTLLFFQQISVIAPLANLIAAPWVGFLIAPLALGGVLGLLVWPPAGLVLLRCADYLLQRLLQCLERIAELPWANQYFAKPTPAGLALSAAGVLLLLAPRGVPARYLGLALCLPLWLRAPERPEFGQIRLTVFDVGQGLAVLAQTRRHNLLFDTGLPPANGSASAGLTDQLRRLDAVPLHVLVVSHADNDHSGGAAAILEHIPPRQVYSSAAPWAELAQGDYCREGQHWNWDGVDFAMLSPPNPRYFAKENDNACVLHIHAKQDNALLTADIEQAAETWLAAHYRQSLHSAILLAPHHGSNSSSNMAFLSQVKPEYVLISAGYRNRYGFPHPAPLARYQALTAQCLNTAADGELSLETRRDGIVLSAEKLRKAHYWSPPPPTACLEMAGSGAPARN